MRHRPARRRAAGACSCSFVNIIVARDKASNLHESPAEERDQDHRQPGGHLGESPGQVSEGDGKAVLLEQAVEGVEGALVRSNVVDLVVENELLEGLGGGRGAVQRLVAELRDGRGLIGQRLGDGELDQRWRAKGPRVAEDVLLFAVKEAKLGRGGCGGNEGSGCLRLSATSTGKSFATHTFHAFSAGPQKP